MPRGIPNVKRDDTGLKYTTFHVPLAINPKHVASTYLKSDTSSLWSRKAKPSSVVSDIRRGRNVLVIHPGSRNLRIGRASDVNPVTYPSVVARLQSHPVSKPVYIEGITRLSSTHDLNGSNDQVEQTLQELTSSLWDRMRFYKMRIATDARLACSAYNSQLQPELIQDYNDPYRIEWIDTAAAHVLVGEKALRLIDPSTQGYRLRWPFHGGSFNTRDYVSLHETLGDFEELCETLLKMELDIRPEHYKDYSVVLVIPDLYETATLKELVHLFLITMGFKQICVQQNSLAATYGSGLSNACVVDIGAVVTTISCVEDGLVIPDTRMVLNVGGNDVTEFLYVLLERVSFPYRDINLARWYDWSVLEDLKARLCTLAEGDVALNMYEFVARQPHKPAEKYGLRAYDEIILAPMCLFEPRVIAFEEKLKGFRKISNTGVQDEIIDHPQDLITNAMMISTQHLISSVPSIGNLSTNDPTPPVLTTNSSNATSSQVDQAIDNVPPANPPSNDFLDIPRENSLEMIDVDVDADAEPDYPPVSLNPSNGGPTSYLDVPATLQNSYEVPTIDIPYEASKLPLDVAIFNCARSSGGLDRLRKYLQAVLVVGGTALIPGMSHALESRLQAIAMPLVPNMEKVAIIPAQKDVDARNLAWKGAAVLAKMDGITDLWVSGDDWQTFGLRGLKERCFYL